MSEEKRPFSQAVILIGFPTLAGLFSAYLANDASNIEDQMTILQLRLDENSLIVPSGFLLPVGDDGMWRDYYSCRNRSKEGNERVFCSKKVEGISRQSTHPGVAANAHLY